MNPLPDIEDIYPHVVEVKHKDDRYGASLRVVKWLEANKVMNIVDFHLDMNWEDDSIALRFKTKKHKKFFKQNKKEARGGRCES